MLSGAFFGFCAALASAAFTEAVLSMAIMRVLLGIAAGDGAAEPAPDSAVGTFFNLPRPAPFEESKPFPSFSCSFG